MSNQGEQFVIQIQAIAQGTGITYYHHQDMSVLILLEQSKVIAMYRTINFNKWYLNQETLYLYFHNGSINEVKENGELQIITCNESQICTNYNLGKYMGFCYDYYFIVIEQKIQVYERNTPNVIFQEITYYNPQFDDVQIKINDFNNEAIINMINYKLQQSVLHTISIYNQIDPSIPSFCNPELAKKQGYFKENGFIMTGFGKHQCILYLLNYVQNGRYMAILRPKNTKQKLTIQNIEEKQTETTEDRLWTPVNYYQDEQFKHFCQLYQCKTDSQYLANKLRLVNQDFIWLVEPYVLNNPHEVIFMKDNIDPLNKFYIIPNHQPNENTFVIQINNTIQIYQHCGYLWGLQFEISFPDTQLSLNASPNKILITAVQGNKLLLVNYGLQTIFANNQNYLVRQSDQITLVTDLNMNILPHPYYNYGINATDSLVNSQVIKDKVMQLTQNQLIVSEILHDISNINEEETQDYNLYGFTAYEEQQSINKQNVMEEELKKKQQEQKADMEDGYDLCLDRDVEDLFRNDYYYIDQEDTNYKISANKVISFNQQNQDLIPLGLLYNANVCYCLFYSFKTGFSIGYLQEDDLSSFMIDQLNCQAIINYQNVLSSIIIKCNSGIYVKGENHDIYFKGINNSIRDVSQQKILLKDMNDNVMLFDYRTDKYQYLKCFISQLSSNEKADGQDIQYNQTRTQAYKLGVLNANLITDYINTDQSLYIIVLTVNNYLIVFDKEKGVQKYYCKVHLGSKLISAFLNNQITIFTRWGLLETRTPSTIQEQTVIEAYLNKQYDIVQDILNQSRIPFTYIPYHLQFVQLFTNSEEQDQSFDLEAYFKFVIIVLEQKHYDLTSTAQFLLHNNLSERQADRIPDYACFNLIYEYCFMMYFLFYLLNIKMVEMKGLQGFLIQLMQKFSINQILENDIYKINHNYSILQYIYDVFTVPCLEILNNHLNENKIQFQNEKTSQLALQVIYWLISHQIALFFNAQNKFALEQDLKRAYLQFYVQYKRLGYIHIYVKYMNIYSDINQIFKLLPSELTQEAGEDLMIGLEEISQHQQLLKDIKASSQLTQLYAQLVNIMSFQGDHKPFRWRPGVEYTDMLLQDGIAIIEQILVQQMEQKEQIQISILQQINNLLFCAEKDEDILVNVIKELYQQLSDKTLLQNVVEKCCIKYKLDSLKTLDVRSYLLQFVFGNQKSRQASPYSGNNLCNELEDLLLDAKNKNGTPNVDLLLQFINSKTDPTDICEYNTMIQLVRKTVNKTNIIQVVDAVLLWIEKINIDDVLSQLQDKVQTMCKNKQVYTEKKSQVVKDFDPHSDQQWKKLDSKEIEYRNQIKQIELELIPIIKGISNSCVKTQIGLSYLQDNL